MSILDKLFPKKASPYEPDPSAPDYDYYAGLRADDETAQDMLSAVNNPSTMPPLVVSNTKVTNPKSHAKGDVPKTFSEPPSDAEDAAYSTWAQDKEKDTSRVSAPPISKPNVPVKPNIPVRPNVTPINPTTPTTPKSGHYDDGFGYKGKPFSGDSGIKPYTWKPVAPKLPEKDVFAFVVENSNDTLQQKERIVSIISQTLENKKDAIFLFVKVGNHQTPFPPMDYKSVKEKDLISSLISESKENELPNLASALFYLVNNLNVFTADTFTFGGTKYKLGNCSIVCIGTGTCVQNEDQFKITSSCISKLQNISKLKAFKYFCIKDSDAIGVSALGFPVIGHIISDFYYV